MSIIPYGHQSVDASDITSVKDVLKSDWLTQGPKVRAFEDALCAYTGARYAVSVSSGTAALHIAALAAGLKHGDEVITSPITFLASANCILYCGARPVFGDIDPETVNIDPSNIRAGITRKTRALLPVHFAGHPCDMKEINAIAGKNGLIVIEDAAHAIGARYKDERVGSCKYSDMAIFSFHPVKTITTGEGGAVLTNSKVLYQKLMMLRNHGTTKDPGSIDKRMGDCAWYYEMHELGFNYRITDIQAALGLSQLKRIDSFIKRRHEIAGVYNKAFDGNEYFDIPIEKDHAYSAYHIYPLRLKDRFSRKRREIFARMRKEGLGVQVHYIPVYLQPYYRKLGYKKGSCVNAESYYQRAISIPIYPGLKAAEVARVIDTVYKIFREAR
ncbi:MAG: UDP-4-amino-4,6-dideoxy-N-acetyl-beta-L-altrosamine transaminase [Candidatus Omnitrophica bacterium]|nr:UDP-4-amino-4,6-dideoxy-N-acetyl-beta-L-altrosamine transaminase [Candidatus Omnitrophota bacterium]